MARYSSERRDAILKKLLSPQSLSVAEVARQENISAKTLYHWRDQARKLGLPVPGKTPSTEDWSAETKLAVIVETAALSEAELSQYCREKGLYPEQLQRWRTDCLTGFKSSKTQDQEARKQARIDRAEIKSLKKDLRIKEKALAEAAALLILRKKLKAFWGEDDEES